MEEKPEKSHRFVFEERRANTICKMQSVVSAADLIDISTIQFRPLFVIFCMDRARCSIQTSTSLKFFRSRQLALQSCSIETSSMPIILFSQSGAPCNNNNDMHELAGHCENVLTFRLAHKQNVRHALDFHASVILLYCAQISTFNTMTVDDDECANMQWNGGGHERAPHSACA